MIPKIFISSTYTDLILHRKLVKEKLSKLDVEIIGMEEFGARKEKPLETCLNEVNLAEIYIVIIGMRYGSVDNESGKSFTQLEYEEAIKLNKNVYVYLIDDYEGIVKTKDIDFGKSHAKLSEFRTILTNSHTVDYYKSENDLAEKIFIKVKSIYPSIIKRQQSLDAYVTFYKFQDEDWITIVSLYNNKPFEIFSACAEEDAMPIPRDIYKGKLMYLVFDNNSSRYDFKIINKDGFNITFEGINYKFNSQISKYDKIITSILKNGTPLKSVLDVLSNMDIDNVKNPTEWKNGVRKALNSYKNFVN